MNEDLYEPLDYAAVVINDGHVSVKRTDEPDPFGEDRTTYRWFVTIPDEEGQIHVHSDMDLRTGVNRDPGPEEMLRTLLSFLSAAAEAYRARLNGRESENTDLFPLPVMEWAYLNEDEIDMAAAEEEYVGRCPVCNAPIDHCQGHGELGDPVGARILADHDEGDHGGCHDEAECREGES